MCIWTSFDIRSLSYSRSERRSPLRAQDSISTSSSSPSRARNSICPASRCPSSVARRNEAGEVATTRTGPSQGPGMRTTYSSLGRMQPSGPRTF